MTAVDQSPDQVKTADVAADEQAGTMPGLSVLGVVPGAARAVWPHVSPMIETSRKAVPAPIAAREYIDDILEKIEAGLYQLWLIYDGPDLAAVAVSSVEQYTRAKVCVIQYLAGRSVDQWLGAWTDEIRGWALENGCAQIECRGRNGWGKKLAPIGAELAGAAYVMEIG